MSSASSFLSFRLSGTSPLTMRRARPSTMAVLPTPGSPISTGLFLVRREQHLDGAADLLVAADHRVQLLVAGGLGQVAGVALERVIAFLGARRCRRCGPCAGDLAASSRPAGVTPASFSALGRLAAVLGDGDQQALGGDEGVAGGLGVRLGGGEHAARSPASCRAGREPPSTLGSLASRASPPGRPHRGDRRRSGSGARPRPSFSSSSTLSRCSGASC